MERSESVPGSGSGSSPLPRLGRLLPVSRCGRRFGDRGRVSGAAPGRRCGVNTQAIGWQEAVWLTWGLFVSELPTGRWEESRGLASRLPSSFLASVTLCRNIYGSRCKTLAQSVGATPPNPAAGWE